MLTCFFTVSAEFKCLAGRSADPDFLRLVVYKAMTFSDQITAIDSCKAYHSGRKLRTLALLSSKRATFSGR